MGKTGQNDCEKIVRRDREALQDDSQPRLYGRNAVGFLRPDYPDKSTPQNLYSS